MAIKKQLWLLILLAVPLMAQQPKVDPPPLDAVKLNLENAQLRLEIAQLKEQLLQTQNQMVQAEKAQAQRDVEEAQKLVKDADKQPAALPSPSQHAMK